MSAEITRTVRLVVESLENPPASGELATILKVPSAGPTYLVWNDGATPALAFEKPDSPFPLAIEAIFTPQRPPRLLLSTPPGAPVMVNDHRAPRLAILAEKDQFRLAGSYLLHVTLFARPQIGGPDAALLGKECPICRVPLTAETTCYRCTCGAALHAEGIEPDDTKLQCVRAVRECPRCNQAIVTSEGYSWFPEEVAHE